MDNKATIYRRMDKQLFNKVLNNKLINTIVFKYVNIHEKKLSYQCESYYYMLHQKKQKFDYYGWDQLITCPHIMAGNNYFEMLKQYFASNKNELSPAHRFHIYKCAIGGGSLELFQYLLDQIPLDTDAVINKLQTIAVTYNRTDIIEYNFNRYKDLGWYYNDLMVNAPYSGNIELFKFIIAKNLERNHAARCGVDVLKTSIDVARLDMIEYLKSHYSDHFDCVPNETRSASVIKAIELGHLQIVQYLCNWFGSSAKSDDIYSDEDDEDGGNKYTGKGNNVDYSYRYMHATAGYNRLDIAKYLFESKYIIDCNSVEIEHVIKNDNLEMLKWIHENLESSDFSYAMNVAAREGHIEILKWLHENRTDPWTTSVMNIASEKGFLDVVQWLHHNRTEGCTTKAIDKAAEHGYLELVQWLHHNRTEGCTTLAMDKAAAEGYLEVVAWLHNNRTEGCTGDAIYSAADRQYLEMVHWLQNNRTERLDTLPPKKKYKWVAETKAPRQPRNLFKYD